MNNPLEKLLAMRDGKGDPVYTKYRIAKLGGWSQNTVHAWANGWWKPSRKNREKLRELEASPELLEKPR